MNDNHQMPAKNKGWLLQLKFLQLMQDETGYSREELEGLSDEEFAHIAAKAWIAYVMGKRTAE